MIPSPLYYILDDDGEPVPTTDLEHWARWMDDGHRIVVQEWPRPDVQVSTVFLGRDHNFTAHGPPVLWESMIFGGAFDQWQERYTSRRDAEHGHARLVAMVTDAA